MNAGRGPQITAYAPDGVGEVAPGDDLAALLLSVADPRDGDIVVVTSKVVSKAEGRIVGGDRDQHLASQTVRVVARRGGTRIVRNPLGLTMAAAGIDASNVSAGQVLLLPVDPDASARAIRAAISERRGVNVGVIICDTAGRAWRDGQTDIAIGAAGVVVIEDFAGRTDPHGNPLQVTAPAVADELASTAELATGKLGARPFTLIRGRSDLVLPAGSDGPGARALVRGEGEDLFGYGAREAVLRALRGDPADRLPFGAPVPAEELVPAIEQALGLPARAEADQVVVDPDVPAADPRVARANLSVLAFAHGWELLEPVEAAEVAIRLRPAPATP